MILDIIFVAIIVFCIVWGVKRGVIKTILGLSSVIVSIIASLLLYKPFMDILNSNPTAFGIVEGFKEKIKMAVLPSITLETGEQMPAVLNYILDSDIISQGNMAIASGIAQAVVYLITVIVFIILIKLIVSLLFKVFKVAAKLPVIKQANGLVGGILGLAFGVFVCWIVAAVFTMFIGGENGIWIANSLENSKFAVHLFKSNILFGIIK